MISTVAHLAPTPEERRLWRLWEEHGIRVFDWPSGARLHWYRENGVYSWPDGSFSPDSGGRVPR